jgi:FkbM family methyltransferase
MEQIPFNISFNQEDRLYWITSISQELDFQVLVTDSIYHAPIVFFSHYLYPGMNYFFSGVSDSAPEIPSLRFLISDKISNKRWELFQNLSLEIYQKRIDAQLDDETRLGDSFENFKENLYKNTQDYIFPEDKSGWFVDLGANLGSYTLLALALGFKKCLVVEPTESLAKSLRNTFRKFPGVFVEQVAITNLEASFISFDDCKYFTVGNRVILDDSKSDLEKVPNSRLIYLIERYNIQKISLIKIDIEGQEQDVILGLEDSIWEIIDRIHLEIHVMHGLDGQKIIHYVLSKGFKVLHDDNMEGLREKSHRSLLFEKSEKT